MPDIKELSDDELASVVGGTGDANCKYPVGTKFIYTGSTLEGMQMFLEIAEIVGTLNDVTFYNFVHYTISEGIKIGETLHENVPEKYFDMIIANGSYSIYNG